MSTKTRCVCETQMFPIMANSKNGQGHMDKYLNNSTKNDHVQYESSNIYHFIMNHVYFFKRYVKCKGQKVLYQQFHKKYSCEI